VADGRPFNANIGFGEGNSANSMSETSPSESSAAEISMTPDAAKPNELSLLDRHENHAPSF
jgi:hypothetical protein